MTAESQNFKIRSGEVKNLRFRIDNPENIDLTGATAKWWASVSNPPPQSGAVIMKDNVSFTETDDVWFAVVTLDRADTLNLNGDYYHELLLYRASPALAQTAAVGMMTVKRTIIRP